MNYTNLLVETENGLCTITINRPDKLNALNKATIEELHQAFKHASSDSAIRAIILTGAGTKAFVAGADISEFYTFTPEQGKALSAEGHQKLFDFVEQMPKPVIAAINGFALGGGLELAMSCHVRLASETARMGLPEVSLGVIPGYGGTQRLPRLVGRGKALEMVLSADMIQAQDALQHGLVNAVHTPEELLPAARTMAVRFMKNAPTALAAAIRAVNAGYRGNNGYETEIEEFGNCFSNEDFKEGTTAFVEKRKPAFSCR